MARYKGYNQSPNNNENKQQFFERVEAQRKKHRRISLNFMRYFHWKKDEEGNNIFSFKWAKDMPTRLVEIVITDQKSLKERRRIYRQTYVTALKYKDGLAHHNLMNRLAHFNELDGKFPPEVIKLAREKSVIPDNFEFHHMQPINLNGTNTVKNLVLIEKEAHKAYHRQLDYLLCIVPHEDGHTPLRDGKKVYLEIPLWPAVVRNMDVPYLFEQEKTQQSEAKKTPNPQNKPNKYKRYRDSNTHE